MSSIKMDTLHRIALTFDNVRNAIKNKQSSERLRILKKEIAMLNSELMVLGKQDQEQYVRTLAMEGYLALLSAKTMPLSIIEKRNLLQNAFNKLKQYTFRDECLFIVLRIQNLLCYYLIQVDQTAIARDILEGMEELYAKISQSAPDRFLDAEDLFTPEPVEHIKRVNPEKIDKVITNNVQMQAFLYNKLNLPDKYTLYNHTALRRQLEMKDGTPQDWAMRTARLGNYFTYLHQMANARHHLCAAYRVLRTSHDNCKLKPSDFILQKTDFDMYFLELSHHWVKYGLTLFKLSKKKVLKKFFARSKSLPDLWQAVDQDSMCGTIEEESRKESNEEKAGGEDGGGEGGEDLPTEKVFAFPSLDLQDMESNVPLDTVTNVEEARKLFAFTQKWLMRAKHYYDFESHSAQYISCSLKLVELYEHLVFFEQDIDQQYRIQKRRADVLEALNSLLKSCENATSVQIDVIRELSQVQLDLMALNLQKLWRKESNTNMFPQENDTESVINSIWQAAESSRTLTERTPSLSRNMFLRKMEATTALSGRLFRLSGQLGAAGTPSQLSFGDLPNVLGGDPRSASFHS